MDSDRRGAIRKVFNEAETPALVVPTCSNCGTVLGERGRFCPRYKIPLSEEAAGELLKGLLAKGAAMDASMSLNDPRLQEAIARIHKEQPEEWRGLVQKITASTKA